MEFLYHYNAAVWQMNKMKTNLFNTFSLALNKTADETLNIAFWLRVSSFQWNISTLIFKIYLCLEQKFLIIK